MPQKRKSKRNSEQQKRVTSPRAKNLKPSLVTPQMSAAGSWDAHPYRPFIDILPLILSAITALMFLIVLLNNFWFALIVTAIIAILLALLFDLLNILHLHFSFTKERYVLFDNWLTGHGRGMLIAFFVAFLILFCLFALSAQNPQATIFVVGDIFSVVMFILSCLLVLLYIASIVFLGFKRIRFQLSLASLLLFSYLFLFFAFAVRRFAL